MSEQINEKGVRLNLEGGATSYPNAVECEHLRLISIMVPSEFPSVFMTKESRDLETSNRLQIR